MANLFWVSSAAVAIATISGVGAFAPSSHLQRSATSNVASLNMVPFDVNSAIDVTSAMSSNIMADVGASATAAIESNSLLTSFTDQGQNLAGIFFQQSLLPYLAFIYFMSFRANRVPAIANFGVQFLLLFVVSTIPAGIISKSVYETSLANVDWLHGWAELLLTTSNLLLVWGLKEASTSPNQTPAGTPRLVAFGLFGLFAAGCALGPGTIGWEAHSGFMAGIGDLGTATVQSLPWVTHTEPVNGLTIPTWIIHFSSVIEYLIAMDLVWKYSEVTGNEKWKGLTWGMLPLHASGICACTYHFFYNPSSLQFLVDMQAGFTLLGNLTCAIAAFRIARANGWTISEVNPFRKEDDPAILAANGIAAQALVLREPTESNVVLAAKVTAATLFLSYAVKYGSLGLDLPFEANGFVALAMVLGIPGITALTFYQRETAAEDGESKPFSFQLGDASLSMADVKKYGVAGTLAYVLTELAFWIVAFPVAGFALYQSTGHWPDVINETGDRAAVLAFIFAGANVARLFVPVRLGAALALAPWVDENILNRDGAIDTDAEELARMFHVPGTSIRLLLASLFLKTLLDESLVAESSFLGWRKAKSSKLLGRFQTVVDNSGTTCNQQKLGHGQHHSPRHSLFVRGGSSSNDPYDDGETDEEEYISLVDDRNESEDEDENEIGNYDHLEEASIDDAPQVEGEEEEELEDWDDDNGQESNEYIRENAGDSVPVWRGRKANRHTSDIILELDRRSSVTGNDESLALRQMITDRTTEYIFQLQEEASRLRQPDNGANGKLPHPRKLLHSLAKRVPAIKQSPDVNLRIHSSRADIDPGVAACIIGRLAFACEQYERVQKSLSLEGQANDFTGNDSGEDGNNDGNKQESAAPQLTSDRRFEQLVECVISGVNVKKRKEESFQRQLEKSSDEISTDIEEILDEEEAHFDEGLNIRDSCRAAWGIAILGAHYHGTMGGVKVNDLLLALSLRIRELLLARLQLLRQGDILSSDYELYDNDGVPSEQRRLVAPEERLNELAEELSEDAASAMWAFGCVKACTGLKSVPLFEACCSILCQDPVDLRRRAQEAEYQPDKSPAIGSSDVIDRLAHSEAIEAEEEKEENSSPGSRKSKNVVSFSFNIDDKDAFLDWLSPVEVTDILWALALHGSNATSTKNKDEVNLSETALTLRETAYDRLTEWLREDLFENENSNPQSQPRPQHETSIKKEPSHEEVTLVEVVDAAALLASEDESSSMNPADYFDETTTVPKDSIAMETDAIVTSGTNSQEVEVVDAATLLASTEGDDEEAIVVETEVMVAPTSVIEGNSVASDVNVLSDARERSSPRIFSPHDLASIAWSVTELRDPLRVLIVSDIIELLWRLGPDGISGLSGTDLSNLAWAIARYDGENHDASSLSITRWIADHALQRTAKYPLLRIFQPPELGRIMWAIACTASTHASALQDAMGHEMSSFFLARKALRAASENLALFSTETLVRIAWAHLEINESNLLDSYDTMALGRILAAAEHSLHRWERVDFATDIAAVESNVESSLFSTFFGRPRVNLPLLEQSVNDDDDEDDMALAPLGRSQRPKLRDLMIDPSTLCKAACGFNRLSKKHPYIRGGWTFTRVAVRLLSSKNARLMKECSIHDIVRLCEAVVMSDVDEQGRELIIGLFARQVVKVLNEVLEGDSQHETSIDIKSASSSELSTLIWALGGMGVKYMPACNGKNSPSKKTRLAYAQPFLRNIRVRSLNLVDLERLARGFVMLKMTPDEQPFLLSVLSRMNEKLQDISTGSELCSVAEAIGMLEEDLMTNSKTKETQTDDSQSQSNNEEDNPVAKTQATETMSIQEEISNMAEEMLNSLAALVVDFSEKLTADEIRRLLEVYSLLPFQADAMIDCLSDEVSTRLEALQNLRKGQSLGVLLNDANKKSSVVRSSLFDESNKSFLRSMKARLVSIFGPTNADEDEVERIDDEGTIMTEEIASIVQDSIKASSDAANRAEADQKALQLSVDKVLQTLEESASFELGRSQELIENYHRTEFATGKHRSRCDRDGKNYISKRVLSRLLP
eukprot:jgi/Psemu1/62719/estExt_Genemark1.C_70144